MADRTLTAADIGMDQDPYAWPPHAIVVPPEVPPVNRAAFFRGLGAWAAMVAGAWIGVAGGIIAAVLILRALVG